MKSENMIQSLTEDFAIRVVNLYKYLTSEKREYIISKQVLRSGTSIGANVAESKYAQSSADFVTKLTISLKETSETIYWLKLLYRTGFIAKKHYDSLYLDAISILRVLTSIVKQIKQKNE